MKRGRSTGKPTMLEEMRFRVIHDIGCICCLPEGIQTHAEIHHLTVGGRHGQKRRGHVYTIGLCCWHHRGIPFLGDVRICEAKLGPSYALTPRLFRETYGQDDALLARQNELINEQMGLAA